LGPEIYGVFSYALSWYLAFLSATYLGLNSIMAREVGRDRADLPQEAGSVEVRHADVRDEEVDAGPELGKRGQAILSPEHPVAEGLAQLGDGVQDERLIVHDEDGPTGRVRHPACRITTRVHRGTPGCCIRITASVMPTP